MQFVSHVVLILHSQPRGHTQLNQPGGMYGSIILSALFYADDLVLISSTFKVGTNKLLAIVSAFCRDIKTGLCASKSLILLNSGHGSWPYQLETIHEVLPVAKCLWVNIRVQGCTVL